jgi:hypothetical protein
MERNSPSPARVLQPNGALLGIRSSNEEHTGIEVRGPYLLTPECVVSGHETPAFAAQAQRAMFLALPARPHRTRTDID